MYYVVNRVEHTGLVTKLCTCSVFNSAMEFLINRIVRYPQDHVIWQLPTDKLLANVCVALGIRDVHFHITCIVE